MTSIGKSCFYDCFSLTSVQLPSFFFNDIIYINPYWLSLTRKNRFKECLFENNEETIDYEYEDVFDEFCDSYFFQNKKKQSKMITTDCLLRKSIFQILKSIR